MGKGIGIVISERIAVAAVVERTPIGTGDTRYW